eukprot:CAMPEP_0115271460 /NCGR_PEP_ID=MMETSP0270-20121206/54114_1 /TAXON_ID=71861 /ORGANISM="Scrippsiella trochoidea, Strain CCMP3099" /LENGTH=246 /DNA_ID=CAMNT_0002687827 /DNA_START=56 /DNA_END=796 /DNA_ORIENTATION=+
MHVQLSSPSGKLGELRVLSNLKILALKEHVERLSSVPVWQQKLVVGTIMPDDTDSVGSLTEETSAPLLVTVEHLDIVLVEAWQSSSMGGSQIGTLRLPGSTTVAELKGHVKLLAEVEHHCCPPVQEQVLKVDSTKLGDTDNLRRIAAESRSPVQVTVHSQSQRDSFAVGDLLGVLLAMGFALPSAAEDAAAKATIAAEAASRAQAKKRRESETLQLRASTRQSRPSRVQARTQQVQIRAPAGRRGR